MGGSSSETVVTGHRYYANVLLSLGADSIYQRLKEIRIGDKRIWQGDIPGETILEVYKENLFGGTDSGGGVSGQIHYRTGGENQSVDLRLQEAVASETGQLTSPAYRGFSTVHFRLHDKWYNYLKAQGVIETGYSFFDMLRRRTIPKTDSFYWGANTTSFKAPSFRVTDINTSWYPEKAQIGNDMNPAHIIYHVLTNTDYGRGYSVSLINDGNFRDVADVLYDEGFGLSFRWSGQVDIEEFIQMINDHIGANVVQDRITGLWQIDLIRQVDDLSGVPVLDSSNSTVVDYQRRTMSQAINEVSVEYTRSQDGNPDTVQAHNLANIKQQGRVVSQKVKYPCITNANLAYKVAYRDVQSLSRPAAIVTIETNRTSYSWNPGSLFIVNHPEIGISSQLFRIGKINLGTLTNGKITIEAVEDVFDMPSFTGAPGETYDSTDVFLEPEPVIDSILREVSYYDAYRSTSEADRLGWFDDVGFVQVFADAPNSDSNGIELFDVDLEKLLGSGFFTPNLPLLAAVDKTQTIINFDFTEGVDHIYLSAGGFGWINNELIFVDEIDFDTGEVTVKRAVLDTVPGEHSVGDKLWFYRDNLLTLDTTERVSGETAELKLLTKTSLGVLEPEQTTSVEYTLDQRIQRPYRPGNFRINSNYFPSTISSTLSLDWNHRDRSQELTDVPLNWTSGNVGPEEGVTYTVQIRDSVTDALIHEETDITTTTWDDVSEYVGVGDTAKIVLFSVRDGLESLYKYEHIVTRQS